MSSMSQMSRKTSEKGRSVSEHPGVDRFDYQVVDNFEGCAAATPLARTICIPEVLSNASTSSLTSPRSSETSEDERSLGDHPGFDGLVCT